MDERDTVYENDQDSQEPVASPESTGPTVWQPSGAGATREIVWIVASGALLIYLFALPIRIQYWRFDFIAETFRELRRWMLIRDIWAHQLQNPPTFGSELVVQVLLGLAVIVMLGGFIYGLRLVLMQDDPQPSDDRVNVG